MSDPVEQRELTEAEKNAVVVKLLEIIGSIPLEDGIECVGGVLLGLLLEANEGNRVDTAESILSLSSHMIESLQQPTPVPEGQVMQ